MNPAMDDRIELAEANKASLPIEDRRRRLARPIPVRLIAVEDAHLHCIAGQEADLDWFYGELLQFQCESQKSTLVYRAENLRVYIDILSLPANREDFRPLTVQVPSLSDTERRLVENDIEFEVQKGLTPGQRSLLLLDPAGNWVELSEAPPVH